MVPGPPSLVLTLSPGHGADFHQHGFDSLRVSYRKSSIGLELVFTFWAAPPSSSAARPAVKADAAELTKERRPMFSGEGVMDSS
jgi:hypothetical protein